MGLVKMSWNRGIISNDCTVNSFIYLYVFVILYYSIQKKVWQSVSTCLSTILHTRHMWLSRFHVCLVYSSAYKIIFTMLW